MEKMRRILYIAVALLTVVSICQAEESLDAKLAKLEAASKTTSQSARKGTDKAGSTAVTPAVTATAVEKLDSKVKTLAERLAELEARQKGMREVGKGLDIRLDELERRLEVSKTQSQAESQEAHNALYAKLAELESKIQGLEVRSTTSSAKGALPGGLSKPQNKVLQARPGASSGQETLTAQVAGSPNKAKPVEAQLTSAAVEPVVTNVLAVSAVPDPDDSNLWNRETLTNGFGGLNDTLADSGIEIGLSFTNIYQANVHGGTSTNQHQGRHTGSYDLEIGADLQQLLGIEGGSLLVHAEGCWSRSDIDATSIGSVFGANGDAGGRRAMDVTEVWYEQAMFDETLRLRFGKMDIGGGFECRGCPVSFDGSAYANDETAQFLNGALVNNPTIPMPDMGLGAVIYWNPVEWWYASIGAIDAQADARETGFRTAFHKEDHFFYAAETGVAPQFDSGKGPMPGAYRIGVWNDPQDKERFSDSTIRRDDTGFYISCDQMVYKESNDAGDSQGLGVFTRYGWANKKVNDITDFWSLGLQYQGLVEGRDDDVLGLGFAKGIFSTEAGYTEDYESVLELYYSAQIAPWIAVSPSVQFIDNPGGDTTAGDAVVVGLRSQMAF
jgi:porin